MMGDGKIPPPGLESGMSQHERILVQPPDRIFVTRPEGSRGWKGTLVAISNTLDHMTQAGYVAFTSIFFVIMLMGVFFRYVLNDSLSWSDELALIVFIWAIFLSVASGYLHDKHVNLDLLIRTFSGRWQTRLGQISEGLSGGYLISLNVSGLQALPIVARGHTDALQWPMSIPYFAIPVACHLMLIHWIRRNALTSTTPGLIIKILMAIAFFGIVVLPLGGLLKLPGPPDWPCWLLLFSDPCSWGCRWLFAWG